MSAVLVVDDERFFRDAIRDALAAAQIECATVASGAEALKAAEDEAVAVVVLDLQPGDMEGPEVLERLLEQRPSLRVVVLSTHADQDRVLETLRHGACDYLAKPLHEEELVLCVRRALEAHGVERRGATLRARLESLKASVERLRQAHVDAAGPEWLFSAAADAVADVLEASKTSVMLRGDDSSLEVAAVTGRTLTAGEMDPVTEGEWVAGLGLGGEGLAVADVEGDERFAGRVPSERYRSGSFVIAPLQTTSGALGVLCATDRSSGEPFGADDLLLLRLLAEHVAPLIEDGMGADDHSESDAEMARAICEVVAEEADPRRLVDAALGPVAEGLNATPVSLYLVEGGKLSLEGHCELSGPGDRASLPLDRGLTGTVLQTGRLVATDDPAADSRFDPRVDTPSSGAIGPFLCVPVRMRGKVLGVARAFPKGTGRASAATGELLAASLSAAVRNVLLYRSLLESVDEVARARRGQGRIESER